MPGSLRPVYRVRRTSACSGRRRDARSRESAHLNERALAAPPSPAALSPLRRVLADFPAVDGVPEDGDQQVAGTAGDGRGEGRAAGANAAAAGPRSRARVPIAPNPSLSRRGHHSGETEQPADCPADNPEQHPSQPTLTASSLLVKVQASRSIEYSSRTEPPPSPSGSSGRFDPLSLPAHIVRPLSLRNSNVAAPRQF
jgi:hypothetical protein